MQTELTCVLGLLFDTAQACFATILDMTYQLLWSETLYGVSRRQSVFQSPLHLFIIVL